MANSLISNGLAPVPLYKEIKIRIIRNLKSGEWKPGDAIPSEIHLAKYFNVSIGTVRKAVDDLVAEQMLVRRQGRGTFVVTHNEDRTLFYFFHIVGKDGGKELPSVNTLRFKKGRANKEVEEQLKIKRGTYIYRVYNLLKLTGKPLSYDELVVPTTLFPDLNGTVIAERLGTIYGLYQSRYGINVIRTSERLSATASSPRIANMLGIKAGTPVLLIKRVAFTYDNVPVELRTSWVNTQRYDYSNDLWKNESIEDSSGFRVGHGGRV